MTNNLVGRGAAEPKRELPWIGQISMREVVKTARRSWRDIGALTMAFVGAIVVSRYGTTEYFATLVGLASTAPLLVVAKAWRLPSVAVIIAVALPVSVIAVALLTGGGGIGADRAARYAYGAALFLAVAAWARISLRRLIIVAGAALVILDQYGVAWFPWWGSGDAQHLMWGTFYWHNQFGIFCAAGIAFGLFLALLSKRLWALLGIVVTVVAVAGVFASGSRASLILSVGVVVIATACAIRADGWRGLGRSIGVTIGALAVSTLLSSSLFFPEGRPPWASLAARSTGGTFEYSGSSRLEFWTSGLYIGGAYPFAGGGLLTYGQRSTCFDQSAFSSNPHNEWILAWAEGGAVAILPLLAFLVGAIVLFLRSVRPAIAHSALTGDPARWGAVVAMVVLLVHSAVDFDGAYAAITGMIGIATGIIAAPFMKQKRKPRVIAVFGVVSLVLLLGSGFAGHVVDAQWANPLMNETIANPCELLHED